MARKRETYRNIEKKSHTCEEGWAHPRISVWHLLMNLKNIYFFKKTVDWANKKYKYFNIYKNKKNNTVKPVQATTSIRRPLVQQDQC